MMASANDREKVIRVALTVRNIDCATCALGIEKQVRKLDGVKNVAAAIMLNKIFVDYDESKVSVAEVVKAIKRAGYSSYVSMRPLTE